MGRESLSTLVVVAHPDDEVIGAGIWLQRRSGGDVHILHITDGSPRDMDRARALGFATPQAYSSARRQELAEALQMVAIPLANCFQFSFADKEAHLDLPAVIVQLDSLIEALHPRLVLSPAYEGGHPDHDAAAFAVACVRELRRSFHHWEFPLYHADAWGHMVTGAFIEESPHEEILTLSPTERALKSAMLACFRTQEEMLRHFSVDSERFREAPPYDFTEAPHPGPLLYDQWGWGITGAEWREKVKKALSDHRPGAGGEYRWRPGRTDRII